MVRFDTDLWRQIQAKGLERTLFEGKYGVEVEEHRVTEAGRLSKIPYPDSLGDRRYHPYLQTDYSETQHELVTAPADSLEAARDHLIRLQLILRENLRAGETIWPLSMPPRLEDDDLDWVDENFGRVWLQDYRDWLKGKYGSTHEIITGVHVNFSISEVLMASLFSDADEDDFIAFKNALYFRMAQGVVAYRWLFVYLFGATPFNLNETDSRIPELGHPVRSLRGSRFGFANDAEVVIGYDTNLTDHLQQVQEAISAKQLFSSHEFYGSIRFKGSEDLSQLEADGVRYLEMRILDTDPFDFAGISENALNVIQLLLAYIFVTDQKFTSAELRDHANLANEIALQEPEESLPNMEEAKELLTELSQFADFFGMQFNDGLSLLAERILEPNKTPAAKMVQQADNPTKMQEWGTQIAVERQGMFHVEQSELFAEYFNFGELTELVKKAVTLGVEVEIIGEHEVRLTVDEHSEVVREPTELLMIFPELTGA